MNLQVLLVLCSIRAASLFPRSIPVGAILDADSDAMDEVESAMRYGVLNHQQRSYFNLTLFVRRVKISDALQLSEAICEMMSEGVFVMMGSTNVESIDVINSYSHNFDMPYLTIGDATSRDAVDRPSYVLHIRPNFTRPIADIINFYGWNHTFYLYHRKEALRHMEDLIDVLELDFQLQCHVDARHVSDPYNAHKVLRQLDTVDPRSDVEKHVIVDMGDISATEAILRQIKEMGMNRARYHYVVTGSAIKTLEPDLDGYYFSGVNLTGFQLMNEDDLDLKIFLDGWRLLNVRKWPGAGRPNISFTAALAYDSISVIDQAMDDLRRGNNNMFHKTFRRGKMSNRGKLGVHCNVRPVVPWRHGKAIYRAMRLVRYKGLSGTVTFDGNGRRRSVVFDVYSMAERRGLRMVGNWSDGDGMSLPVLEAMRETNETVDPAKIKKLCSILTEPFMMERKMPPEKGKPLIGNDRYIGYCKDLADETSRMGEFSYVIKVVADGKYGSYKNNTWNGMIGELVRKEADLVIAPLTITSSRERVVDFSKPFMNLGISIMIKRPEKQKPGVFSFMQPLSLRVWISIAGACFIVSFVLFLVSRISPIEWVVEKDCFGVYVTNEYNFWNSLWYALGAFMQQGGDSSPRSMSGRIVASVWSLFTLILISSYTANLAAFLTIERMNTPINSAEELAAQSEIKYGTISSGSTSAFFEYSKVQVYSRMWTVMDSDSHVFVSTKEEGVDRVRKSNGKYAFLMESKMNEYTNQRKPCNTMKVGENLDSKGYGIATPLNSPIKQSCNLAVLRMAEEEILSTLEKKWWYDKSECVHDEKDNKQSALSLSNLAGGFYVLIGGLGLALLIAMVEFCHQSKKKKKSKKNVVNNLAIQRHQIRMMNSPQNQLSPADTDFNSDRFSVHKSVSTYTYTAPAPLVSYDPSEHSHTDV